MENGLWKNEEILINAGNKGKRDVQSVLILFDTRFKKAREGVIRNASRKNGSIGRAIL